ncbi:MAG: hypothetical protein E6214_05070, partial [Peptoniphilus harei]|nr:hypothetical protein [Peptoniphilus harei]
MPVDSLADSEEDNHALSYDEVKERIENKNKDEECDLNFALKAEDYKINYFLKNSLGFGGHNACLIFKRY